MSDSVLPQAWPERLKTRVAARADGSARVARVARLVAKYARSLNLTGADGAKLWDQVGEAVAATVAVEDALGRVLSAEDAWIDIGSGGGFPGLVLAALVDASVVLVEPREKRVAFLELGMGSLGRRNRPVFRGRLEGAEVLGRDGERFSRELDALRESAGKLIWGARAVFSPDEWVARNRVVAKDDELVVLHLSKGTAVPDALVELSRVDFLAWTIVVGRH